MKRWSVLLVCVVVAACATESVETSTKTQGVYQGKQVPTPPVQLYTGGPLPAATSSQVWVFTRSPLDKNEYLAVETDTSTGKIVLALRVPPQAVDQFHLKLGATGAGYIRPTNGTPPPPPDVWPTWYVAAAYRLVDLPDLATADAYAAPY